MQATEKEARQKIFLENHLEKQQFKARKLKELLPKIKVHLSSTIDGILTKIMIININICLM